MARTNSAEYGNEPIDAYEVDDEYESFERDKFVCPTCYVKIQFNRGINKDDPHFKNWPKIEHKENCGLLEREILNVNNKDAHVHVLTSTILPRAERFINLSTPAIKQKVINRYLGKRSQKFLNSLLSIDIKNFSNIHIKTEDKKTILLSELIMRQDEIIEKLDTENGPFICILIGVMTKRIDIGQNIKIPLTFNGKYKNIRQFNLFIPASYREKNVNKLSELENSLIYCYGLAEKNQYGYKMDLYSITHQVAIIKKANQLLKH